MIYKIYSIIIWTILCSTIFGIIQNKKYSSNKIKFWYLLSFSFLFVSFIMKIYMFLGINLQYLYLFKHIYYLNYLGSFFGMIISIFIFLRSNSISFNYIKIFMIISCLIYMFFICTSSLRIKLSGTYGYIMIIENSFYINLLRCVLDIIIIFISSYILKFKHKDRIGALLVIIYALIQLLNIIMGKYIIDLVQFIEMFIQLLAIVIMNYSIVKLKKNRISKV